MIKKHTCTISSNTPRISSVPRIRNCVPRIRKSALGLWSGSALLSS